MRQSFRYTLLITWLFMAFSCQKPFVQKSYETQNVAVSEENIEPDSNIVSLYAPYKQIIEKDMNRVISYSSVDMKKGKPESLLTNFLADLLLAEGAIIAKKQGLNIIPDVSFFNYGGIRTSLPEGVITVGKVFELMPFENEMVFLALSGKQMQAFLNYIAYKGGDSLGGARFKLMDGKAQNTKIGGKEIQADAVYWLVTNDYVADGGDGLDVLKNRRQFIKTGTKIRDVIIANLEDKYEKNIHLSAKEDGRFAAE